MNAFPDGLGTFFIHMQMGNILFKGGGGVYLKEKICVPPTSSYNLQLPQDRTGQDRKGLTFKLDFPGSL